MIFYITDPNTGLPRQAASYGEALSQVPIQYILDAGTSAGTSTAAFVNYLFVNMFSQLNKHVIDET